MSQHYPKLPRRIVDVEKGTAACYLCSQKAGKTIIHPKSDFTPCRHSKYKIASSCRKSTLERDHREYSYRTYHSNGKQDSAENSKLSGINRNNINGFIKYFSQRQFDFQQRFNLIYSDEAAKFVFNGLRLLSLQPYQPKGKNNLRRQSGPKRVYLGNYIVNSL
jgi:hypothetical protein